MTLEPTLDLGGALGVDVVQYDMHGEFVGYLLVDQVEEAPELAGPLSRGQVGDHVAGGNPASSTGQVIEHRVEIGGAVTQVTVDLAGRHTRQHRPGRRRVVERRDLGLLVHAQDDGCVGRIQIETGHVPHFVD